jgi:hypothetical protein
LLNNFSKDPCLPKEPRNLFKILIFDDYTKDIVQGIFDEESLRKHGVTMSLSIDSKRERVKNVTALYFISNDKENSKYINYDLKYMLYDEIYLNYISQVPRPTLQLILSPQLNRECLSCVKSVHDDIVDFVSLDYNFFTLNKKKSFVRLNSNNRGF